MEYILQEKFVVIPDWKFILAQDFEMEIEKKYQHRLFNSRLFILFCFFGQSSKLLWCHLRVKPAVQSTQYARRERTRERERGEKINDVRDSWCIVIEFGETRWHGEDKGRYSMDAHARQTHMLWLGLKPRCMLWGLRDEGRAGGI